MVDEEGGREATEAGRVGMREEENLRGGTANQEVLIPPKSIVLCKFRFSGLDEPEPVQSNELAIFHKFPDSFSAFCPSVVLNTGYY